MSILDRCYKHLTAVIYECSKMIGCGRCVNLYGTCTGINDDFLATIVSYGCKMIIALDTGL